MSSLESPFFFFAVHLFWEKKTVVKLSTSLKLDNQFSVQFNSEVDERKQGKVTKK